MRLRARLSLLTEHQFESALALATLISCITFLIRPGDLKFSPIGRVLHPWDYIWNVGYGLGGLLTLAGLMFRRDLRAGGLWLLAAGLAIQALAVADVAHPLSRGLVTVCVEFGFAAACIIQARRLRRGRDTVTIALPETP